ncbi:MAG: hypothetical protein O2840_02405 [bacterium]|nr:hypothetical protein [bacterium]
MQKLTIIFVSIVLLLFVLTGLYIRSSETEKAQLRSQVSDANQAAVQPPGEEEAIIPDETASAAAMPGKKLGTLEGSLSFPSSGIPDTLEVCAENTASLEEICSGEILKGDDYAYGFGYKLEVPPGEYTVYARLPNDPYRAYYSDFVICGSTADCPSHKPVVISVEANITYANVDPQDWYDTKQ